MGVQGTQTSEMACRGVAGEVGFNGDWKDKDNMLAAIDKWLEVQLAKNADDYASDDNEKIGADEDIKEEADKKRTIINRELAGCNVTRHPAISVYPCPATADPAEGESEGDGAVKKADGQVKQAQSNAKEDDRRRRLLRA